MTPKAKNLDQEYPVLSPSGKSEIWKAEDFWKMAFNKNHPKNNRKMGYLVSSYQFDRDWDSWENHPNGDELVYCLSGKMKFILEVSGKQQQIELKAGEFTVIPKNTWHTAHIRKPARGLFITWGFGTKHRKCDQKVDQSFDYSLLSPAFESLAKPAQRALLSNGINTPADLAKWKLDEVLKMHGIGSAAATKLKKIMRGHANK